MMNRIFVILCAMVLTVSAQAQNKKSVVAYFSATGTTEKAAKNVADVTGAELYEILPAKVYTSADLDWHNKQSRSSVEMANQKSRPALKAKKDLSHYDLVYLGFPIWWGVAPRIINTFIEQAGIKGRVIVFVTSGSSSVDKAFSELKKSYPQIMWLKGVRIDGETKTQVKKIFN